MGGKGRRRREKNYREAHGGYTRLPPAPDLSKVDALPSKLRKLMALASAQSQGDSKVVNNVKEKKKNEDSAAELKSNSKVEADVDITCIKDQHQVADSSDENVNTISNEKRKKKRKRKQVEDLRFETSIEKSDASKRKRERKKKYLEARKSKHKEARKEENLDFPRHEKIKFGDIVQAPPKLVAVPKAFKNMQDASKERVRLQAIEAYRKRKGWTSRPGNQLPNPSIAPIEL